MVFQRLYWTMTKCLLALLVCNHRFALVDPCDLSGLVGREETAYPLPAQELSASPMQGPVPHAKPIDVQGFSAITWASCSCSLVSPARFEQAADECNVDEHPRQ